MRIAFIHPTYPGGQGTGTSYTATQLVHGLVNKGHNLTVYCHENPPSDNSEIDDINIRIIDTSEFPYHPVISPNKYLCKDINKFQEFDIVHSYPMHLLPTIAKISKETPAKTMISLNGYRPVCPKNDLQHLNEHRCRENGLLKCTNCIAKTSIDDSGSTLRTAAGRLGNFRLISDTKQDWENIDKIHTQSPHVVSIYEEFGFSTERISVIPNILDKTFCVDHVSDFSEPYKFLYVGDLNKRKGVQKLPKIAKLINDKGIDFKFSIVGDGNMKYSLSKCISDLEIANRVSIEGRVPYQELPRWYAEHDLFVYPGVWDEPFARVLLESMAAGTPVVASDVGTIDEILGKGGTVTSGSEKSISDEIARLVSNKKLKNKSEEAYGKVREYMPSKIIDQFVREYKKM